MGEFGAFRSKYPTPDNASEELKSIMLHSCLTYGFQGWLAWTWDTWEQNWMLWDLVDNHHALALALAPHNWSHPCFQGSS
mmetsp:Transcript_16143/g.38513  ORF Transcript_16143/g.38513 Transcript_16143/m.38513 type:complete len:80 (+) Transcript_16143:281-520(+)